VKEFKALDALKLVRHKEVRRELGIPAAIDSTTDDRWHHESPATRNAIGFRL
jgi:hypothetical protein